MIRQVGFTIAELLVVLIVMMFLTAASLQSYVTIIAQGEIKDSQVKIAELFLALNEFYWRNCRFSTVNPQPSKSTMVNSGLVSNSNRFHSPISDTDFQPSIIWSVPPMLRLQLSITTRGGANAWLSTLSADSASGNTLTWLRPAGLTKDPISAMGREFSAMYEPGSACNQ